MGYFDDAMEAKNNEEVLEHHGILGQKWGVRRFQRTDGTLTSAGKNRLKSKIAGAGDSLKSEMNKRKTRKEEFKKNLDEVNAKSSAKEHVIYNSATRARAAKIMTKNKDVKVEDAIKQAEKEARRNTALAASLIVSYGIVKLSSLNNNSKAILSNTNDTLDSVAKSLNYARPKAHTGSLNLGSSKKSSNTNFNDVFSSKKK